MSVELRQTYYTDAEAAAADPSVLHHTTRRTATIFRRLAALARPASPRDFNTSAREVDSRYRELRTDALSGPATTGALAAVDGRLEQARYFIEAYRFQQSRNARSHGLSVDDRLSRADNSYGSIYSIQLRHAALENDSAALFGFYNAQCCGIALEYQTVNLPVSPTPSDRRFFMSFTLAGLGNFSPFNGALGGIPR